MLPELKKTEGMPDAVELDATRRISAGAVEPQVTQLEEKKSAFASLRDRICPCPRRTQEGPAWKAE